MQQVQHQSVTNIKFQQISIGFGIWFGTRGVGRQNLAHPQIQQLGDGAVFESSDKILPWFCCSGTSSDGLLLRSVPARTSSSKPCPASATAGSPRQTTSAATHYPTQAVLGRIAKTLGAMEEASHSGYTPNRCRLAWRWLSAVLEMALQSWTDRRPKNCQQRGSGADFPDGR